jgi:hypothetical protein
MPKKTYSKSKKTVNTTISSEYSEVKENLLLLMEKIKGNKDELKRYFDYNKIGHNYSQKNLLWVIHQHEKRNLEFPLTKLASYKDWTSLKGTNGERVQVKPGAFKVFVYTPRVVWEKDENGKLRKNQKGKAIPEKDENGKVKTQAYFKQGNTFDLHQTNAREIGAYVSLEFLSPGKSFDHQFLIDLTKKIEDQLGYTVEYQSDFGSDGRCSFASKNILVSKDLSINEKVAVLLHEAGHALLHTPEQLKSVNESVVSYEDIHQADSLKYKEAEAESFSYIISKSVGIEQPSENYLAHYSSPDESIEYLSERLELLTGTASKFSREINIKGLVEEYNYRDQYPLHYLISQSDNTFLSQSVSPEELFSTDHEGNNLLAIALQSKNIQLAEHILYLKESCSSTELEKGLDFFSHQNNYGVAASDVFNELSQEEGISIELSQLKELGKIKYAAMGNPSSREVEENEEVEAEIY